MKRFCATPVGDGWQNVVDGEAEHVERSNLTSTIMKTIDNETIDK
jgi:hypothetical protein